MAYAGRNALNDAVQQGACSYSTASTNTERWSQFTDWLKAEHSIRWMEDISRDHVIEYGRDMAEKVDTGDLAPATAQNYLSAINSVMSLATKGEWQSISPTKECDIGMRSRVREDAPGSIDRNRYESAMQALVNSGMERQAAIAGLARELGLRSKEACLINARAALNDAEKRGEIRIIYGTKGGRPRSIEIRNDKQIEALQVAARAQGEHHSLVPRDQTWKQWRDGGLRDGRETLKEHMGGGYHDLRAGYACERYKDLTGTDARIAGGALVEKSADEAARQVISNELGHGRTEVVSEYIGGRG